jgi:hypothetical protein
MLIYQRVIIEIIATLHRMLSPFPPKSLVCYPGIPQNGAEGKKRS